MEIAVNNITPTCGTNMEPFYYEYQQQLSTINMGTTQIIKENKPPMNTYAITCDIAVIQMQKKQYNVVLEDTLLPEMYKNIDLLMYGS